MNEFGPKNNAPGLENECRQIQSNSHVYICINEQVGFQNLTWKFPNFTALVFKLETNDGVVRFRFDSSTTFAVAGSVTASLAFFFFFWSLRRSSSQV